MYVVALDRPWLGTPFLYQGFEIKGQTDIEELRRYCKSVYVDILPRHSLTPAPELIPSAPELRIVPPKPSTTPPPTEAEKRYEHEALRIVNRPGTTPVYSDLSTLEQELEAAQHHYYEAHELIYTAMEDARLGKTINVPGAKKNVSSMVESVIRNPDALTCFTHLKKKDEYTALHGLRVCILALIFGRHLGMDEAELNALGIGALFHDIGKIKVPDEILNKPDPLTGPEIAVMQRHVKFGVEILERSSHIPAQALEFVRNHHERYTGSGYLEGLKGDAIGLFGMIGGIVDSYDALTSDRPYRLGISSHTALKKMYEWRGRDFHPHLVEQFIQSIGIYPIGSVVELNTGEIGVVVTMNRQRRLKPRVAAVLKRNYTPYAVPRMLDLTQCRTEDNRPCEIERVLDAGAYGINPVHYLPVAHCINFSTHLANRKASLN